MPNTEVDSNPVTLFAQTNFRNQQRRFGIRLDDRRRHVYILGKTGMGKTVLLENMFLSDVYAGHGCAYVDPHGDTAERLINFIPSWRINDVVYFNPADVDYPMGFNILETIDEGQKHLVGSGLMGVFKKIWPDVWSPRMEYILLNCVLALLDFPGATLLGINRLLVDKDYRQRVIENIRDPIVKTFWVAEFSSWSEKYATEAIAPVQNKVGQFLSASIIRNIVAQVKSTIVPRRIMDEQKIFIVNLSKGRIGEDNMRLLGGMLITKMQLAAMERVDTPEHERKDFFMYVDEFQNFANPSFASILSEARKYRLALILAHQYIEQLDETVRDAVFGNIGTMIMFRVGSPDAQFLETEFAPTFTPEDLTNLPKYHIYLKLMVDGVATEPFSATTLPPISSITDSQEKVISVTRERYAEQRDVIEKKVLKWSGMESGVDQPVDTHVEASGPVTTIEPPSGFSYPSLKTAEEQEADDAASEAAGEAPVQRGEFLRFSAERLASIVKAPSQGQKKDKPKFKHTCSRCGKVWEMPIQLDPTRPMYCSECLPLIRDEKKVKGKVMKAAVTGEAPEGMTLEEVPSEPREGLEEAMRDVEEGRAIRTASKQKTPEPNRPRIIVTNSSMYSDVVADEDGDEERSELLDAIADRRGAPVDTRKQSVVPPAADRQPPRPTPPPSEHRHGEERRTESGESGSRRQQRSRDGRPSFGDRRPRITQTSDRDHMDGSRPLPPRPRDDRPPRPPESNRQTTPKERDDQRRPPVPPRVPSSGTRPPIRSESHPPTPEGRPPSAPVARTEPPRPQNPSIPAAPPSERSEFEPGGDDRGTIGDVPKIAFKTTPAKAQGATLSSPHAVRPGERIKF